MTESVVEPPARTSRVRALLGASAVVTMATVAINLLGYALAAVGTRMLGPGGYGELAALLGLLLVGNVPALTLQVVVARRIAAGKVGGLGRASLRTTAAVVLVAAAALPILHPTLHISWTSLIFLVVALVPMTLFGALMGAVQGGQQFARLAAITTLSGAGRSGGALVGLAVSGTAAAAMVGMAIGAAISALAAVAFARGSAWHALSAPAAEPAGGAGREVGHAAVTMLAAVTITTVDVLLAQHFLSGTDAGLYGAGAVVIKVALWLPYAVTMIALPRLAVARHRRTALRVSIAVLAVLGVLELAGILVLGPVLFPLAVGPGYEAVNGWLWLFVLEGATLAIAQLVIMSRVAATDRLVAPMLWVALLAEVGIVTLTHGSIGTIAIIATVTAATVVAAGLLMPIRPSGRADSSLDEALGVAAPG